MVQGNNSKRPPTWKTEMTAAKPAPRITPAFNAGGIKRTTFYANPVAPSNNDRIPSVNWKAISE